MSRAICKIITLLSDGEVSPTSQPSHTAAILSVSGIRERDIVLRLGEGADVQFCEPRDRHRLAGRSSEVTAARFRN